MPKRILRKQTSPRSNESCEDMRQTGLNITGNDNYEETPAGTSRSLNQLIPDEYDQQTSPAGIDEALAVTNENVVAQIIAALSLEEQEEQYQPQPDALSFPNFIADPISMDLRHLASSSTHITAIDNMSLGWTSEMPVSDHFTNSNFPSLATDTMVTSWNNQNPVVRSSHSSSIANETHVQGGFYRASQSSLTQQSVNRGSTGYYTTALQRQASYSSVWEQSGPMGSNFGFGSASIAPQTDPVMERNTEIGIGNIYGSSLPYPMNISQHERPHPWELQRPRGFSRVETQTTSRMVVSNDIAGPSNIIIPPVEDFSFHLGMPSTNPSEMVPNEFRLVDLLKERYTRISIYESIQKLVSNDDSGVTEGPDHRCHMCDGKIDLGAFNAADNRFCSDCYHYVYLLKRT